MMSLDMLFWRWVSSVGTGSSLVKASAAMLVIISCFAKSSWNWERPAHHVGRPSTYVSGDIQPIGDSMGSKFKS